MKYYNNIYNKVAKATLMLFVAFTSVSCVDTEIIPDDLTVDDELWQSKSKVTMVVNSAYKAMINTTIMQEMIVWGDFRSDELNYVSSINNGTALDLAEISSAKIETDNMYSNWAPFYSVINYCNIVLEKAGAVTEIDPNYTIGDYNVDRSQMIALRSLCYFYLIRAFRDVPYTETASLNSSDEQNLTQEAPLTVLNNCITALESVKDLGLSVFSFNDWRRVGYFTQDAMYALLADMYLWRASIMHSASDYQKCIEYCDWVINNKINWYKYNHPRLTEQDLVDNPYCLTSYDSYFNDLFVNQNGSESILELQYDGTTNSNTWLCQMYNRTGASATTGYLTTTSYYGTINATNVYTTTEDIRAWESVYGQNSNSDVYYVRKGVAQTARSTSKTAQAHILRDYDRYAQNWILYRMTDVMLMKAEALVQLGNNDKNDQYTKDAFDLVYQVNLRAIAQNTIADKQTYALKIDEVEDMELLVMQERARELCFEGKRWFDMLRYNYRHVDNVNYAVTLGNQNDAFASVYEPMLNMLVAKYASGGSAIKASIKSEPYLYMPVLQREIDVNPALIQNPVYHSNETSSKNN